MTMLDRRRFLSAAAAGGTWLLASKSGVAHQPRAVAHDLAHPDLLLALGASMVRELGDAYRALVPAESDRAALESALHTVASSSEDPVRADFAAGRVIVVRDWILSVTEARQCALYSLRRA